MSLSQLTKNGALLAAAGIVLATSLVLTGSEQAVASSRAATGRAAALPEQVTAPGTAAPPRASSDATNCADVLFVGARGSGEKGPGTPGWQSTSGDPYGLGIDVNDIYKRLVTEIGAHRTIQVMSVHYAANSVLRVFDDPPDYFANLAKGVTWAMNYLGQRSHKCPDQQIVLAGFSQGAMVMHRVIHKLEATTAGQRILARLANAVLIGDGDQVPHDTGITRFGSAPLTARGIGLALRTVSHSSAAKFTVSAGDKVLSVCNKNDIVCGWTDANIIKCASFPPYCRYLVKVNLGYTHTSLLRSAADRTARDVLAVPQPTPQVLTLNATVGTPFNHQLTADVSSGYTLQWEVVPPESMPSGLDLAASGLISGTPSTAGSSTAHVRVRSVHDGTYSAWVPATVKLHVLAGQAGWTLSGAPVPDNAMAGDNNGSLETVACPSPTWCVAVGSYTDSQGVAQGMVASGSPSQPGAWVATEAPLPDNASAFGPTYLTSVACGSPTSCVAIGSYQPDAGTGSDGLLLTWSGTTWTPMQAPLPANAFKFTNNPVRVDLSSVACARSSDECVVAGQYYVDADGNLAPLLLTGSSASWTAVEGPLPPGAAPNTETSLAAITCPSATTCVALGTYGDLSKGLVIAGSGSAWQAASIPPPAGGGSTSLNSITCVSPSSCVAAGDYLAPTSDGSAIEKGLIAAGSGTSWTTTEAPLPDNAGHLSGDPPPPLSDIESIACSSSSLCVADGTYATNSPGPGGSVLYQGLLETRSGSAWTTAESPIPEGSDASDGANLSAIDCPSGTACIGVGGYNGSAEQILLVTGSGKTWTAHPIPLPADASTGDGEGGGLNEVACGSQSTCVALGSYIDNAGNRRYILVTGPN